MQVKVFDTSASEAGTIELSESVFGIEPNIPVMHQAHLRQRANGRLGTHKTPRPGGVRGGGRKPRRPKGTGGAREGAILCLLHI